METSRQAAKEALNATITRLRELHVDDIDEILTLNAVTPYPQVLKSTIGREVFVSTLIAEMEFLTIHPQVMVWFVARNTSLDNGTSF